MVTSPGRTDPLDAVRLRRLPAFAGLALRTRGPYWKLSGTLSRLRSWMEDAGIEPAGPPLGLFHDDPARVPPEEARYTLCYPLDPMEAARATERLVGAPGTGDALELLEFPSTDAATAEYRGPAADSPAVYARVDAWMEERGYLADGPPREVYLAEPGTLGKGLMHAEVQQPVVKRPAPAAR